MSEGLNECRFLGNLGDDPSLRFTQSQQAVLNFRIGCTERYLDNNSKEWKERTEWVTIVVWGKRAEALNKLLHKGSRVFVAGRMQTRSYEKDGSKRYATEIVANNVILLGGRGEADASGGSREQRASGGSRDNFEQAGGFGDAPPDDDHIPF